jgi:1-deoxy-D-xylulose-5-phosphate reductoisomerase
MSDIKTISILGSTGSVGVSTLNVVRQHKDKFKVCGLAAGNNVETLAEQVREFSPTWVSTKTEEGSQRLRSLLPDFKGSILWGTSGAETVASAPEANVMLSAFVGAAGLRPTIAAAKAGKTIALANKETMVVAGALVSQIAKEAHAQILPVDSEHSAIFQAMVGTPKDQISRLVLTASGGPFFRNPEVDLSKVTVDQALAHPNWKMGSKITIDSATMMNKGLEIIEARWLFDFPTDQIDVVVHPQSIIHSMVEFLDGSVLAQLGPPDMCGPIAYALSYPNRLPNIMKSLDFGKLRNLEFFEPDHRRFPSPNLARQALSMGETFPAVLNGANEVTVEAFLAGKIGFLDIAGINEKVLSSYHQQSHGDLENYIEADGWGRKKAKELIR